MLSDRVAILRAGLPGSPGRAWSNRGDDAVKITFEVEATTASRPNKATIDLTNLGPDSRGFLETPGLIITLEVGYQGFTNVIATGDVADVDTTFAVQDAVTRITLGDGEISYLEAQFDRHFGPGTTSAQVIEAIRSEMGLGAGYADPAIPVYDYPNGVTFTGDARDALDRVLASAEGAEWSIQDGALQTLSGNAKGTATRAVRLDPGTGLLSAKELKKGVEVVSLLVPRITPGQILDVRGRTVEGFFVVRQVKHAGDALPTSEGAAFTSVCRARRLDE